jgi:hypothetical protein
VCVGVGELWQVLAECGRAIRGARDPDRRRFFVEQGRKPRRDLVRKNVKGAEDAGPPLLAMNRHGRFEKGDPGSALPVAGRGAAFGDLNNDGWMDVVATSLGDRPQFFLNRGGSAHWLTLTLRGTRSNRDGYGARVMVNGQLRFATATGSYLSSNDKRLHSGSAPPTAQTSKSFGPRGFIRA